jgi:hypothetical protein
MTMARGVPVQPEQRARAIKLAKAGKGRNEIAKLLGLSAPSVTRIIAAAGLSFDRSKTAVAVEAHRIDRAAVRADIIDRMYKRSQKILSRVEADSFTYRMPTQLGSETVTDDAPPPGDEKNLASAVGIYLDKATRLELVDNDSGVSAARSMLADLGQMLGVSGAS